MTTMTTLAEPAALDADLHQLHQPLRGVARGATIVIALTACMVAWLVYAPLSGAIIGPGVVKVDSNRKTVQHQEGGIVSQVLVRNGDRVKAGQTLLVLGDVRVDAARDMARIQLDSELARAARLDAERIGADDITFPEELTALEPQPRVLELLARERTLFNARRTALVEQLQLIEQQAAEVLREIAARTGQMDVDPQSRARRVERQ
ncbi:MAG: biotin/lipoyl-binding protein [Betaproteobacteria bacterium]|nr:biotin/lipoyl-binding protein [Betaproteobacteria bacterium]